MKKKKTLKWFLEKSFKKLEAAINTCVLLIKQHWKKIAEITQKCVFFLENSKFC